MQSNRNISQYKLGMLKKIITDYDKTTIPKEIQDNIANAHSVGEILCELFSNQLFDFYEQLKNDLANEGITVTASEMLTIRKSDKTYALLWLACSERGIKEIKLEYLESADVTILNTCVDGNNEIFWYKLSRYTQNKAVCNLFELIMSEGTGCGFSYKKGLNKIPSNDALNLLSAKDNVCTWNHLIKNSQYTHNVMN